MTLDQLKAGFSGIITSVDGEGALRRRFLEMGIIPNTPISVQKLAPFGDPIEVSLRGYQLTLRLDDAKKIQINGIT